MLKIQKKYFKNKANHIEVNIHGELLPLPKSIVLLSTSMWFDGFTPHKCWLQITLWRQKFLLYTWSLHHLLIASLANSNASFYCLDLYDSLFIKELHMRIIFSEAGGMLIQFWSSNQIFLVIVIFYKGDNI